MTRPLAATRSASAGTDPGSVPPVWFVLPPGFTVLDTTLTRDRLEEVARQLTGGDAAAGPDLVPEAVDALAAQFDVFRAAGVTFAAAGAHPRSGGGVDQSTLTAAVLWARDVDPDTLIASLLMAESERDDTTDLAERRLPAGPSVVAERTPAVGAGARAVRVVRADVPTPDRRHFLVLELTTTAVGAWDEYLTVFTEMLLPSVTFTDPAEIRRRAEATAAAATRLHTRLG